MGLSDCPQCWDAICVCGYLYRHWDVAHLTQQIHMLERVLSEKLADGDSANRANTRVLIDVELLNGADFVVTKVDPGLFTIELGAMLERVTADDLDLIREQLNSLPQVLR